MGIRWNLGYTVGEKANRGRPVYRAIDTAGACPLYRGQAGRLLDAV